MESEIIENNPIKDNRSGKFVIHWDFIKLSANRDAISSLMSKMIVVAARHDFMHGVVIYFAYSELFEINPPATICPEYKIIFSVVDYSQDPSFDITVEKVPHFSNRDAILWDC